MKRFDVILFIKAKRKIRFKRFKLKGGERKVFDLLDKRQLSDKKKNKNDQLTFILNKKIGKSFIKNNMDENILTEFLNEDM